MKKIQSIDLLRECQRGYLHHTGMTWKKDKDNVKRKVPNMPSVRYEPAMPRGKVWDQK